MAWTAPITWSGTPTAAQFNEQIRDNQQFLYDSTLPGALWPTDPRAFSTSSFGIGNEQGRGTYLRLTRGGPVTNGGYVTLSVSVTGSGCWLTLGVYSNTGAGHAARPFARLTERSKMAVPAVGLSIVGMSNSFEATLGDWVAMGSISDPAFSTASLGGGSLSAELGGPELPGQPFIGGRMLCTSGELQLPPEGPSSGENRSTFPLLFVS